MGTGNETMNLFDVQGHVDREVFEELATLGNARVERIVSTGQVSPPGFWYDQERDEFVVLLKGSAGLLFEGKDEITVLGPGDYLNIPAHVRHRVEWTDQTKNTIWLAVFY